MERITITIDDELLATVDALVDKRGYPSRSEAIRELLRESAKRDHAAEGHSLCVATLTYVYDHSIRDLPQRIVAAQHDHHELGIATTHIHFDHDSCLEVSILRGRADAIQRLADGLTAQRGVRHANLHMIPAKVTKHRHSHEPGGQGHGHEAL
ncbi:nickel-responsive transcriptional regulator NikR [Acidisoma sp.]|uniref:nickel-responsive transcriptional regulator NikR n=1 Tax=Acidisoma sp. TaxID=1872115 RepID=UPI003B00C39E